MSLQVLSLLEHLCLAPGLIRISKVGLALLYLTTYCPAGLRSQKSAHSTLTDIRLTHPRSSLAPFHGPAATMESKHQSLPSAVAAGHGHFGNSGRQEPSL
jgi:hypothetical protein